MDVQLHAWQQWVRPVDDAARYHTNVTALFRGKWEAHNRTDAAAPVLAVPETAGAALPIHLDRSDGSLSFTWACNRTAVESMHLVHVRLGAPRAQKDAPFRGFCDRPLNSLRDPSLSKLQGNLRIRGDAGSSSPYFNMQGVYLVERGLLYAVGTTLEYVSGIPRLSTRVRVNMRPDGGSPHPARRGCTARA